MNVKTVEILFWVMQYIYPHFSQTWLLMSSCNSSMCLFKSILTFFVDILLLRLLFWINYRHIIEYHEKVYGKTVHKLHQKGVTWRSTWQGALIPDVFKSIDNLFHHQETHWRSAWYYQKIWTRFIPYWVYFEKVYVKTVDNMWRQWITFSQTWFLVSSCISSTCIYKLLLTFSIDLHICRLLFWVI